MEGLPSVKVTKIGELFRIVDVENGVIVKTSNGNPFDGGGTKLKSKADDQAAALNLNDPTKNCTELMKACDILAGIKEQVNFANQNDRNKIDKVLMEVRTHLEFILGPHQITSDFDPKTLKIQLIFGRTTKEYLFEEDGGGRITVFESKEGVKNPYKYGLRKGAPKL